MRFRATILGTGKTAAGIEVPAAVVASLGSSKKPPVKVTINGHTYRSTVAVMGGVFMLGVSNENRASAGVAAGDQIDVDLELDTAPREVEVPADLAAALDRDPGAKKYFEGLSYSGKLRHAGPIARAKGADTRERLIAKSMAMLREGRS